MSLRTANKVLTFCSNIEHLLVVIIHKPYILVGRLQNYKKGWYSKLQIFAR